MAFSSVGSDELTVVAVSLVTTEALLDDSLFGDDCVFGWRSRRTSRFFALCEAPSGLKDSFLGVRASTGITKDVNKTLLLYLFAKSYKIVIRLTGLERAGPGSAGLVRAGPGSAGLVRAGPGSAGLAQMIIQFLEFFFFFATIIHSIVLTQLS